MFYLRLVYGAVGSSVNMDTKIKTHTKLPAIIVRGISAIKRNVMQSEKTSKCKNWMISIWKLYQFCSIFAIQTVSHLVAIPDQCFSNVGFSGNRADMGSRMENGVTSRSGMSSRMSHASQQARLEIDEVNISFSYLLHCNIAKSIVDYFFCVISFYSTLVSQAMCNLMS